jgi:hypothetical protein
MKALRMAMILAAVAAAVLAAVVQQGSAKSKPGPTLLGTLGACNNVNQGGPCTQTSTLVQIDPLTGALIKTIGPVGFTVNGLAWDAASATLYASTPPGDTVFHGLITIDLKSGAGKPVKANVVNFGLPGDPSPIHSITIDAFGQMVGWYDEFPPPAGVTDTFVRIDKHTGVATEFTGTGINTSQNGLSFSVDNLLWNIDSPRIQADGGVTQTAYLINPFDGKPISSISLSPPTAAALGDFNPANGLYYGLDFDSSVPPPFPTFLVTVDVRTGTVTTIAQTVDDLHTITFIP